MLLLLMTSSRHPDAESLPLPMLLMMTLIQTAVAEMMMLLLLKKPRALRTWMPQNALS